MRALKRLIIKQGLPDLLRRLLNYTGEVSDNIVATLEEDMGHFGYILQGWLYQEGDKTFFYSSHENELQIAFSSNWNCDCWFRNIWQRRHFLKLKEDERKRILSNSIKDS
ncbi:MAG: hypothetical protein JSW11_01715 [Candidatus Heimdallarchaeota archaeon]|nr:MAG: hypothetical protein JSW11_01715 [Candidatus Heimdallarchaeota archaeon]